MERVYPADRRAGRPMLGASPAATAIGCPSTLADILREAHGLAGIWPDLSPGLVLVISGMPLARRVRVTGARSIAEIARRCFGPGFGTAVPVCLAEFARFALMTPDWASLLRGVIGLPGVPGVSCTAASCPV